MFIFTVKMICLFSLIRISKSHLEKDQILSRAITAFGDNSTVQSWLKYKKISSLSAIDLFKTNLVKVRDTLAVMNAKKYSDMKSLVLATNMYFEVGYPYYETMNILSMLKQILKKNEEQNESKSEEYDMENFYEEILYEDYGESYKMLEMSIARIGLLFNYEQTNPDYNRWAISRSINKDSFTESKCVTQNISLATNQMKLSNDMIEAILPTDRKTAVYVGASSEGFENSRKSSENGINFYIREKTTSIFPDKMSRESAKCTGEDANESQANLADYMNKTFVCNKITAKLLIALFHYYSEIKNKNTMYEIKLNKNNEYQFKWTIPKDPSIKEIKKYWLKQEIKDLSSRKKIHKFGMIVDYHEQYSTEKSAETESNPIKTRLILLSCGHQLGFDLIDEFLTNFYVKYSEPLKCHVCRNEVQLIGSYNTVVYKYK